jgi:DnaJ family protein C protein 7
VEANAVLSDPQRRERYDMGEEEDGMNDGGMGGMGGMSHMDLSELFSHIHGGQAGFSGFPGQGPRGHSHSFSF